MPIVLAPAPQPPAIIEIAAPTGGHGSAAARPFPSQRIVGGKPAAPQDASTGSGSGKRQHPPQ
jgi:hypothetical protein